MCTVVTKLHSAGIKWNCAFHCSVKETGEIGNARPEERNKKAITARTWQVYSHLVLRRKKQRKKKRLKAKCQIKRVTFLKKFSKNPRKRIWSKQKSTADWQNLFAANYAPAMNNSTRWSGKTGGIGGWGAHKIFRKLSKPSFISLNLTYRSTSHFP